MRILLIDPPWMFLEGNGANVQVQPLGLAYVGAVLAHHHDVRFLLPDTRAYCGHDPWGEIERAITAERPELVGITAMTASYAAAVRVASIVKRIDRGIPVVIGGVHASDDPERALRGAPDIDFAVCGEGEHTVLELVAAVELARAGRSFRPEAIAGLTWRDTKDVSCTHRNASRPLITDLDTLPFPMRDQLVWPDDVHQAFYSGIVTVRGCPYQCIYCAVPNSEGRRTRYRSAWNVVDEISWLRDRYGVGTIFFHDSVFSLYRKRTIEICRLLEERRLGISFHCQTRTDRVDPTLLELMRRAGCMQVFFGIESGDEDSLTRIRKDLRLAGIREAVGWAKALGMHCSAFFMVGFPWETVAHIERTTAFAVSLDLDAISLFSAVPLPGTELWKLVGDRAHMPASIDFRTPQVNLTTMSDATYKSTFERAKSAFDAFNRAQMMRHINASAARVSRDQGRC